MNILNLLLCVVKIGFVSDTHVATSDQPDVRERFARLEQAYRIFKAQGATSVFNLGDIANTYDPAAYADYVKVREKVFPEGVNEVFVYHNHDRMQFPNDDAKSERAFAAVQKHLGAKNGRYHSFMLEGCHFLVYPMYADLKRMEEEIAAACKDTPGKPVFVLDHVPPVNTSTGSNTAGSGATRRIFDKYPQVVVFSGHVHGSTAHEGKIWQGGFTSVGMATLKGSVASGADYHVAVMELDEKRAVIRRYALSDGAELHPEAPWTIDFPYDPANPRYSPERRAKETPLPSFAASAQLKVEPDPKHPGCLVACFPSVTDSGWLDHYRVTILTNGIDHAAVETGFGEYAKPLSARSTSVRLPLDAAYFEGTDRATVMVTPVGFFGNEGPSIRRDVSVGALGGAWKTIYKTLPDGVKAGAFQRTDKFPLPDDLWRHPPKTRYRLVVDLAMEVNGPASLQMQVIHDRPRERLFGKVKFRSTTQPQRYCYFFETPKAKKDFALDIFHGSNRFRLDSFRIDILEP